jgi:hypothetical protein
MDKFAEFFDVGFVFEHVPGYIVDVNFDFVDFFVHVNHHTADIREINVRFCHLEGSLVSFVLGTSRTQDDDCVACFVQGSELVVMLVLL